LKKRVTIHDIASELNISTTTVNKALSGKPKVSEKMRIQVVETAASMGYLPNKSAQALARRELKIGVIVSKTPDEYSKYILQGFEKGFEDFRDLNVRGIFRTIDNLTSTEQSIKAIRELRTLEVDGIIIQPVMGYKEYVDLIEKTIKSGIHVVASISKLYDNIGTGCVRINSKIVGQMAGEFMSLVLPKNSKVAIFTSNHEMQIHREYVEGFKNFINKEKIDIVGVYETKDIEYIAYNLTEEILQKYPDLNGIYVTSYVSVPVCKCIRAHNRQNDIMVIGQDLFPELVDNLINNSLTATIFQDQFYQGRKAVEMMFNSLTGKKVDGDEYLVIPKLVMKSNLSCYKDKY
jgi:LacI family transcriptional regulator